jgi:coenzyme F420 hydrogenase subunit beta
MPKTIDGIDRTYQCIGCGVCAAACPHGAIKMVYAVEHYMPARDASKCDDCGLCVSVCPGLAVDTDRMASELWPEEERDALLGTVKGLFSGYAADVEVRYRAASGGTVT